MSIKRNKIILAVFTLSIMLLILRALYIQLVMGEKLFIQATAQKVTNLPVDVPRGNILDRNLIPLTNRKKKVDVIIQPLYLKDNTSDLLKISNILELNFNEIKRQVEIKKEPLKISVDENKKELLIKEKVQGISFIHSLERYDDSTPAKHVVGYLNKIDMTGQTGIEKAYENYLKQDSQSSIAVITDAKDNPVKGLGYRFINPVKINEKLNVKLTIDYNIQKTAEEVMERYNLKGAVVIEEVNSGDIVAMVSKPDYNPNEIEKYLESPDNELFNRAVASYNLGSIFKIIDLASAYSKNIDPSMYYYCPGYVILGDKEFRCSAYGRGGHGLIDLHEAFASSCNPYFIELGIKIGPKSIIETAIKFGFGQVTGIDAQGVEESAGILPKPDSFTYGDTANISIGQGDVLATPLQVADMVATIANGGIKNNVNIVDSIVDSKGNTVKVIRKNKGQRIIDKGVCDKIKQLMEEVTVSGTGTRANLSEYGGAGGKTGSAETGQYINGEKVVHAWFAGYFPRLDPKYSVAVFIEDGKSGGAIAAPIFEEIAKTILKKGF
ncbi:peptidoglycan D,D-transpeptidase FtsI family protein [Acetivibrio straminisolvens]|jgi:peptidoglycan glycosyltransferase/penicillin-binding protein 2|uniref:Cell division protein FtsI n=1 Tax=Acetivibrio straminisolvens JCM 21531 TaxID=1294263 RepID=W4V202_9FIRM|nr:penicillin-binding transpeptidase domain-containing protein [Acetivibrio straminisolvens]GAE87480.1 cell division protein FtsI [Acetivibrio straminisolvens JCM 21531]